MNRNIFKQGALAAALHGVFGLAVIGTPQALWAQTAPERAFDLNIRPQKLATALSDLSTQTGVQVYADGALVGTLDAPAVRGSMSAREALTRLLSGSGLSFRTQGTDSFLIQRGVVVGGAGAAEGALPAITAKDRQEDAWRLPQVYAGGQVARGGRLGMLGNMDVLDAPFNVASYTEQMISDQQARSVADVLGNNPSARVIYPDNDGSTDFMIRGNKVSQLDIAYDGLYGLGTPGIESLERVEVLVGANALLNGLGPLGGVGGMINQVPKRAANEPLTRLTASYISSSQFGGALDFSRRFGETKQFGIRLNAAYRDGDMDVSRQSRKVTTATVALDYLGSGVRLSSNFGYRKNDNQSPSRTIFPLGTISLPAPPKDPKANWQQSWSYDNSETTFGTVRGEFDITPDVTAYAAIGGSRFKEEQLFSNSILYTANGDISQRQVYWPLYRNSVTAETGLRGALDTGPVRHKWSLAASALRSTNGIALNNLATTLSNIYTPVFIAAPSVAGLADAGSVPKTGETSLSGVALADTLTVLDDKIQLTLGVRRQTVVAHSFAVTGAQTSAYSKDAVTYAAGLTIKPMQNFSVYGNYIEGLQQGPTAPVGAANAGAIFSPYVSKQYEVGAKYDFGGFLTTLSLYQLSTPNGITNPATLIYGINGEQKTKGLELNTYGELTRGVRLLGGVALTDSRQTRTAAGTNDGKKVTGASDVQINLGGEWDAGFLPGLTLSTRAIYTSRQFADAPNLQSIPSWIRYDAGVRFKTVVSGHATVFRFNVENLANKSYWSEATQGYLIQSRPRTFILSVSTDL
jgi:iron complex outermembrane receptor protein